MRIHQRPTGKDLQRLVSAGGFFLGIDNGLKGGIAYVHEDGSILTTHAMPTMAGPVGRVVDARALANLIPTCDGVLGVAFERPHFARNFDAARSMFDSFGVVRTVLLARGFKMADILFPRSLDWQPKFWIREPAAKREEGQPKPPPFDTKPLALEAAVKLWPGYDFRSSANESTPHDGIVDACLLAEFVRQDCFNRFPEST